MARTIDIAWLGGLLEGEGYFSLVQGKYPSIGINMTAEDTIIKVADMWNKRVYHRGNQWRTVIAGAYAIQWMFMLYPFLGECRQKSIREIVKFWKEYSYAHASPGIRIMSTCHPNRKVQSLGLCNPCYKRQYREEKKKLLRKVG